jgi:hypothetical protein
MERLKTTPAANRGCDKAYIKQYLNYNPTNALEQYSVDLEQMPYSVSSALQRQRILDGLSRAPLTTLQAEKFLGVLYPAAGIQELRALRFTSVTGWTDFSIDQSKHRIASCSLFVGGE